MDPQESLFNLLDAMRRNDRDEVDALLEALAQWNRKSGFLPFIAAHRPGENSCWRVYREAQEGYGSTGVYQ